MRKYGKDESSSAFWQAASDAYAHDVGNDYHRHRLQVVNSLLPAELYSPGKRVLDFGCGEGTLLLPFLEAGAEIAGLDAAPGLVAHAQTRLKKAGFDPAVVRVGGVDAIEVMPDCSLDAVLSINVLAYLSDNEHGRFMTAIERLVKPGGHFIVTHSNELFDLFSLNHYTLDFFMTHLVQNGDAREQVASLLAHSDEGANAVTYNVRANPLTYRRFLNQFGFEEVQQEYYNLHEAPPAVLAGDRTYPSTLDWPEEQRWKLMFVCSAYGSRSVRSTAPNVRPRP